MERRVRLSIFVPMVILWLGAVLVAWTPGCVKAPPNLTPQASAEFYATQAIHQLDTVRDLALVASDTTPPLISKATLGVVVNWHEAAVTTLHATPAGWRATALAALDQLQAKLSAADAAQLKAVIDAARTYLQESAPTAGPPALLTRDTLDQAYRSAVRVDVVIRHPAAAPAIAIVEGGR